MGHTGFLVKVKSTCVQDQGLFLSLHEDFRPTPCVKQNSCLTSKVAQKQKHHLHFLIMRFNVGSKQSLWPTLIGLLSVVLTSPVMNF